MIRLRAVWLPGVGLAHIPFCWTAFMWQGRSYRITKTTRFLRRPEAVEVGSSGGDARESELRA